MIGQLGATRGLMLQFLEEANIGLPLAQSPEYIAHFSLDRRGLSQWQTAREFRKC